MKKGFLLLDLLTLLIILSIFIPYFLKHIVSLTQLHSYSTTLEKDIEQIRMAIQSPDIYYKSDDTHTTEYSLHTVSKYAIPITWIHVND